MKTTKAELVPTGEEAMTTMALVQRLRAAVAHHAENILAEVPATLRRLRTLLLVLSVSIPLFLIGLVVVLWRLAH